MFGKKGKKSPEGESMYSLPPEQSIEKATNPFVAVKYDDYDSGHDMRAYGVVSALGVEIKPGDYGVEDLKSSLGDYGSPSSSPAAYAGDRIIKLGETLNEEQITALQHATDVIRIVGLIKEASEQALNPVDMEAIDNASSLANAIMVGIFEPLIDEQERRNAKNAEYLETRRRELLSAGLAKRAELLGELEEITREL